jgi:hypothetical protein
MATPSNNGVRIFQISDDLFWGYRVAIDVTRIESLRDAIRLVKDDLIIYLKHRNLLQLVEKVSLLNLHMHEPMCAFTELSWNTSPEHVLYLCSHDHSTERSVST